MPLAKKRRKNLAVSNYAYVLNHGRIESEGEAHQVREMESVRKAYLGA